MICNHVEKWRSDKLKLTNKISYKIKNIIFFLAIIAYFNL